MVHPLVIHREGIKMKWDHLPEPMGIIYMLRNTINEKVYIGQTITPKNRVSFHLADKRVKRNLPLYRDVRRYGRDNFEFIEIDKALYSKLNELENHYIDKYRSFVDFEDSNGYNRVYQGKMCREAVLARSRFMGGRKFKCINDNMSFEVIRDAADHYGLSRGVVKAILNGYSYATRQGLRFEYEG